MFSESELMFTPDNAQTARCQQIPVISDEFAEETELFLIRLSSSNVNVVSGPPVQVTILDQDSEATCYKYTKDIVFH